MQLKKGTDSGTALNGGKLKLVNDVLLYYNVLYQDDEDTLAEDPTQWDVKAFRKWKNRGYPLSTDAYNASKSGSTTNVTVNTTLSTIATAKQKLQDNAFLSWRRSKQDETTYPVLEANRMFTDWILKFERKIYSEEMYRMIDPNFHINQLDPGSNTELFKHQKNHLASILKRVL